MVILDNHLHINDAPSSWRPIVLLDAPQIPEPVGALLNWI